MQFRQIGQLFADARGTKLHMRRLTSCRQLPVRTTSAHPITRSRCVSPALRALFSEINGSVTDEKNSRNYLLVEGTAR